MAAKKALTDAERLANIEETLEKVLKAVRRIEYYTCARRADSAARMKKPKQLGVPIRTGAEMAAPVIAGEADGESG